MNNLSEKLSFGLFNHTKRLTQEQFDILSQLATDESIRFLSQVTSKEFINSSVKGLILLSSDQENILVPYFRDFDNPNLIYLVFWVGSINSFVCAKTDPSRTNSDPEKLVITYNKDSIQIGSVLYLDDHFQVNLFIGKDTYTGESASNNNTYNLLDGLDFEFTVSSQNAERLIQLAIDHDLNLN